MIIAILWYVAVVIVILLLVLSIGLAVFILIARHQILKFQTELPWLKWMTLEEVVAMGFSRFWARLALPLLHKQGNLEVRLGGNAPSEAEKEFIELIGFGPTTVEFYQFKLTKRTGRKKIKFKDFLPALRPAHA